MSRANPVRRLNAEVARKIAAGEVIDRPSAIVRELMDNAIDSGADKITVEIAGGGIDKVRIVDNGCGMTREDLAECAHPHSTSKISEETDLLNLTTLGFRGEALSSIAAVCRLSITSGGHKMRASITEDHIIEQAAPLEGTIVQAEGLFENFPARRRFLKRPATETAQCRNTFIEKCLPFPQKSFRLIADGGVRLDLPAGQTLSERFVRAMEFREDAS
ncbi:MAG: DNA mismatch repair endonuclease MutL, partial [Treponemataceae bacterium]|nr:DNA mismatch repair endonuclease MutL [Treponemataceae bacterium]